MSANALRKESKKQAKSEKTKKRSLRLVVSKPKKVAKQKKKPALSQKKRNDLVLEYRVKAKKLAVSILRRWRSRLNLDELGSIIDLSLCEAALHYDPTKGANFLTFLYYHLKGNLIRAITVAASENIVPYYCWDPYDKNSGLDWNEIHLNGKLEAKDLNVHDIADSLFHVDQQDPEMNCYQGELMSLSHETLDSLDDLEKQVIHRIFILGEQLIDVASSLGYSRCHISRVKKKALDALKSQFENHLRPEEVVEIGCINMSDDCIADFNHKRAQHQSKLVRLGATSLRVASKSRSSETSEMPQADWMLNVA